MINSQTDIYTRLAKKDDLPWIINLQRKNLDSAISAHVKESQGFVSIETGIELLEEMIDKIGITVAISDKKVIGYLFAITEPIAKKTPIIDKFVENIDKYEYGWKKISSFRYCILWQICIEEKFRWTGVFNELYKHYFGELKDAYDIAVWWVCSDNNRSLHVHKNKLWMEVISEFKEWGKDWHIVVLDFKKNYTF
ncbi:MAG: acetyltransferase [uncultured bacterium (gcode 4)]|uniref:Acetyltransferase n=1 Tax=uncultured bacterium (gcode 4) TaxID=1234023 RepID=K2GX41_9BACT|nr:MAG: acetyltransferase [uncultured bacterium (gcode 4)]